MSEGTAAAVITACAVLGAAVLALLGILIPLLVSIRRRAGAAEQHSAVAADQTANDHGTNLRVELDERHAENADAIAKVVATTSELAAEIRAMDRRNGRRNAATNRRIDSLVDRVQIVEDTHPRPIPSRRKR